MMSSDDFNPDDSNDTTPKGAFGLSRMRGFDPGRHSRGDHDFPLTLDPTKGTDSVTTESGSSGSSDSSESSDESSESGSEDSRSDDSDDSGDSGEESTADPNAGG